jgi:transcriptional regulator with XRE-family HTH domain
MKEADRLQAQLATIYEMKYARQGKTLDELSQNIGVTKSYVSKFLNGKLAPPSEKLLSKVRSFIKLSAITPADERRLVQVLTILDRADDADAILAAIPRRECRG